jgi:hypothetical protein
MGRTSSSTGCGTTPTSCCLNCDDENKVIQRAVPAKLVPSDCYVAAHLLGKAQVAEVTRVAASCARYDRETPKGSAQPTWTDKSPYLANHDARTGVICLEPWSYACVHRLDQISRQ